jgi:outer membrane protein assembly factor BamB
MKRAAIVTLLLVTCTSFAVAENWPSWRGPQRNGVSGEKGVPTTWSKTDNVAWRVALPGQGGATPIGWGDKIFVTSAAGSDLVLMCVGTDGKVHWKQVVGSGNKKVRGDEGNYASPTPCTDGQHVWTFFGNGLLACYDMDGKEVWKTDVSQRFGKFKIAFGMSSTPILDGDKLYLQLIHGEGNPKTREATVVALDKSTGETVWRHSRESDAVKECEHSYASPFLYREGDVEYLITHGADYAVGHRLSDGEELWRVGRLNPKGKYNQTLRFVASPVGAEGLLVIPSAKNGPVLALNAKLTGDVSEKEEAFAWVRPRGTPDVPSPLIKDGLVYLCRENGNLVVVDAKSGEEFYEKRTVSDRYRASPVYADGYIYVTSRKGIVSVVKAGREFELVSSNEMGEELSASPAISNGRKYLRTFDALYAIEK